MQRYTADTFMPYYEFMVPPDEGDERFPVAFIPSARLGDTTGRNSKTYGFPMHASCYTLADRVIGPSTASNLRLFFQVLEKVWDERPRLHPKVGEIGGLDPLDVPEIEDLIAKSITRRRSYMAKQIFKRAGNNPKFKPCPALTLPSEISSMVLDHLGGEDVRNLLAATQWMIPKSYWRIRIYRGVAFEIHEVSQRKLDWQFLCLEPETLLETNKVLRNRRRIVNILNGIADLFSAALETDDPFEILELARDKERRLKAEGKAKIKRKRKWKRCY